MLELIAAAALLTAQDADPDRIIRALTAQDIANLMLDLGGASDAPLRNDPTGFVVPVTFASGLDARVEGYNCAVEGQAVACREYSIRTQLQADSPADAERIAADLRTIWLDARANEDVIIVARMDFTHGGVGVGHVGLTFQTFDQLASPGMAMVGE